MSSINPIVQSWSDRAQKVMPGRQSNFRFLPKELEFSLIMQSSEGVRHRDVGGDEYLDYVIGMGPAIWGHSNRDYLDAIVKQIEVMFSCGSAEALSDIEIEVAEKIIQHLPSAEWVRFGLSGSESVQVAIRVARGYTERSKFVRFQGHYHGWLENVFGGVLKHAEGEPPHTVDDPTVPGQSAGRSKTTGLDSYVIPWNNVEALEQLLEKYGDQIALVLMEPVMCNFGCCPPKEGYLERVRELCTRYGVVLCFDEVITGFRAGLNSGQGLLGVTPDLTILGKAFAGGLPLSAVAGKKEILQVLRDGKVLAGGTFNSFPLAMAGAKQSISMLEEGGQALFDERQELQSELMNGIKSIGKQAGHDVLVQGPPGIFYVDFSKHEAIYDPKMIDSSDHEKRERFFALMIKERILIAGGSRFLMSFAHQKKDIDETLDAVKRVMKSL